MLGFAILFMAALLAVTNIVLTRLPFYLLYNQSALT